MVELYVLIIVSYFFAWRICPNFQNNYSVVTRKRIKKININQANFAKKFDLPYYNLGPAISQKIVLGLKLNPPAQDISERYYFFEVGVVVREITLIYSNSGTMNDLQSFKDNVFLSNSIHCKQQMHKNGNCTNLSYTNVHLLTTMIETTSEQQYKKWQQQLSKTSKHMPVREFKLGGVSMLNFDSTQLILRGTGNNGRLTVIRQSFHFATALGYMVRLYRVELILDAFHAVPKIITEPEAKMHFLNTFFFFNYWVHPEFLISKNTLNLKIRTLEKNSLLYIYENIFSADYWLQIKELEKGLKLGSFILLDDLLCFIENDPLGLLHTYVQFVNPLNITLASSRKFLQQLSEEQQQIVFALSKNLLKKVAKGSPDTIGAVSLTQIVEMLGYNRGTINQKIKKRSINALVNAGILKVGTKKDLQITRTNASEFFYLNPSYIYTQAILAHSRAELLNNKSQ